jgi:hypothetical protein
VAKQPPRRKEHRRLGKAAPRYRFFLNPYADVRFTKCPQCRRTTKVKKLPVVIHVDPMQLVALNKTCRYCPTCDLLIAHQNEIEALLAAYFGQHQPEIVGNEYLVIGTEDRADWARGMREPQSVEEGLEVLHDFIEVVRFEPAHRWGWGPR